MYDSALAELRVRWRSGDRLVSDDDIGRWSNISGLPAEKVFDLLSVELAEDFFTGFLGWEFADSVANALYGVLLDISDDVEWPNTFFEFYIAFDHSERHEPRTRELIRPFLGKHRTLDLPA
ncbi:hypothetical protein [Sphingomonas sp. S2-65]|uniref:hypothetical protein n=1 Tax=Sphingomonas sp. S2-65 TaxID=2903960 RepID=UPI001F186760|nr:hypothetical protein [Sphingomonas sp. S2-65]UYY57556.1 hypothetical protein LZ586_12905 [Sphingomonas sp. S2-65]